MPRSVNSAVHTCPGLPFISPRICLHLPATPPSGLQRRLPDSFVLLFAVCRLSFVWFVAPTRAFCAAQRLVRRRLLPRAPARLLVADAVALPTRFIPFSTRRERDIAQAPFRAFGSPYADRFTTLLC